MNIVIKLHDDFLPGKSANRYIEYQNGERVTTHWPGTLGLNNKYKKY